MSGFVTSVKHVRYAMGSLTALLFGLAAGGSL
jgi:hypothetical protein